MNYTKRTLENLSGLNRKFRTQVEAFLDDARHVADKHGITIEVISGFRTRQQQAALFAQGRTKPGRVVTNAQPWQSWHNYGLAIDLGLFANGRYLDSADPRRADRIYAELGKLAASLGIEWAGTWKSFTETPHFQNRFGMSLAQARAKMQAVNFDVQKIV